ncbi:MAG: hypothetical protein GY816_03415, partial [Cytophagales bacterium]|nr:hypothetical protein [Cytophagales bacterium]
MLSYLRMDVYQLADIFNHFRKLTLEEDKLDPVNFVGIPGLTWAAAFKYTNAKIDLLQDESMYEFFESGIRGGCSFVNKHYLHRNSPDDDDYDANKEHVELLYTDSNNLYGNALSMKLPQRDFQWVDNPENINIPALDINGDTGYVFEVDLHIPAKIHDETDDFPLAPTPRMVDNDMITDFMKGTKGLKMMKLLMTRLDKHKYVVHFALLQFYIQMGAQVTKIHRAIKFYQ